MKKLKIEIGDLVKINGRWHIVDDKYVPDWEQGFATEREEVFCLTREGDTETFYEKNLKNCAEYVIRSNEAKRFCEIFDRLEKIAKRQGGEIAEYFSELCLTTK